MAGVEDVGGGGGRSRRNVDTAINMVPFIDLLLVTVSFLLITAVWTSLARVSVSPTDTHGSTKVHGPPGPASLHARISTEKGTVTLQWQDGTRYDDIATVPLDGGKEDALRDAVRAAYAGGLAGRHLAADFDVTNVNEAYVHAEAKVPLQTMMTVIDAIDATTRKLDEKTTIPAFHVSLSST